jgi:hypothetical protein
MVPCETPEGTLMSSICPFCGVVTETPHETQAGCIEALNAEIVRMRAVLDRVRSTAVPGPAPQETEEAEGDRRTV